MASSVYSEVTSVSTYGYERDRVLDKLQVASKDLPYSVDDITISHNDFAVADVYNDSIKKLYANYLFLIANAEIVSDNTPISAAPNFIKLRTNGTVETQSVGTTPNIGLGQTTALSALKETFIVSQTDNTGKLLYFNYSKDVSCVYETNTDITTVTGLLSTNEVEFNKTFKFKNVVSVDTSDNYLFVLDKGANTVYKFDISGLITSDKALKRTNFTDKKRPGRYLLKTIGGEGIAHSRNKIKNANSISVYKDRIYILDNGNSSIKIFDLEFNFIDELSSPSFFNNPNYGELVSIVVDQFSDTSDFAQGYVLSSRGRIITYDIINNRLKSPVALYDYYDTRVNLLSATDLSNSFKKIVNSKIKKNILYICNQGRIYKYYKTNLKTSIAELDVSGANITIGKNTDNQEILSFDTTLHAGKEYIAVTTVNYPDLEVSTYMFVDEHETTKLYNEDFYTNYFTLSNILVLPQEVVNNITFNKTTKKLIYNHYSFFENLNKKIYSFYNTISGIAPYPALSAIVPHQFEKPIALEENKNLFIGVNEPLLTDIINRPLKLLYEQQAALFDLIKENSLNSNPPVDQIVYLPGDGTAFPNLIKFDNSSSTIKSGDSVSMTVSRVNLLSSAPACSFKFYTIVGGSAGTETPVVSSNIEYYDSKNAQVVSLAKNENSKTISIATEQFFGSGNKTFRVILEANSNSIIDPDADTHQVNITPTPKQFTVSLSASTGSLTEGNTSRVQVKRIPNSGVDYTSGADTSVNIQILNTNIEDTQYTPVVPGGNEYTVVIDKFADFPDFGSSQVSAAQVKDTSTITFTERITSVVFDLSAVNDLESDFLTRILTVVIDNPSENAELGTFTRQEFLVNDDFETISLHLSSISATYRADGTSNDLLSCVNIWEALSASTEESNGAAFSAVSATRPVEVNFTVNAPLSVFSVSALSGAIQFEPTHALNFNNNKLNVIVDDGSAVVGKGGQGGHGGLWLSGYDFTQDGTGTDDLSASLHSGESGGHGIGSINMDTYFNVLTIQNSGIIYGGSGGGGGGVIGVSAQSMPAVSALSAGSGGGGGQGLHSDGAGVAGLAAIKEIEDETGNTDTLSQDPNFAHIFMSNGAAGSTSAGGAGGAITNLTGTVSLLDPVQTVKVSNYPAMSGLSGGGFGEAGGTDGNIPVLPYPPGDDSGTGFGTISAAWAVREGGDAGGIARGTFTSVTSTGTGITKGHILHDQRPL